MAARSKARKRALDLLYAADMRREPVSEMLTRLEADGEAPTNPYSTALVLGVVAHGDRIDDLLGRYSTGWTLDRMPAVDRNVLRLGVFELLYDDDVPDGVAISEAMALVRELSTDDSPSFVNGVLGAIQRDRTALEAEAAGPAE